MIDQALITAAEEVIGFATANGVRVASVESITGGRVAAALTSVSGAGKVFFAGGVFYDTDAKKLLLGIPEAFFAEHSVYSPECARLMASSWCQKTGADFCVATTGEAETEAPGKTGTVYFGVASRSGATDHSETFTGERAEIQDQACLTALRLLFAEMRRRLP
jgi:PncC family amidohydrolase